MENCLYVVKRDDEFEPYILVGPIYNLASEHTGWIDQKNMTYPLFEDDVIITKIIRRVYLNENFK